MILDLQQIKSVTTGAVRISQENDGIHFYRFTKEQEDMYLPRNQSFYDATFSTPGIRLRFQTNSSFVELKFSVDYAGPRSYFGVDISVDGVIFDAANNYSSVAEKDNYVDLKYSWGTFSKRWDIGTQEKEIQIYLPWSVNFVLQELVLEDGATLTPVRPEKKALCFGDSITHGADALRPSSRYISRFCDYLGAEEHCKAICGEFFWPQLANTKESFKPDYITVAYGTNDWSKRSSAELEQNCFGFFRNLAENYPDSKLIVITPLWRADEEEKDREIPLSRVHEMIREAVKDHPNATVICGNGLVPHDPAYFGDFRLHPNDAGFDCYFKNLKNDFEKGIML